MYQRLIPYRQAAYEPYLVEYAGTVIVDGTQTPTYAQYVTPGISVSYSATGSWLISLSDKVPLFENIGFTEPPAPDLSCIDYGYASTCQIFCDARPQQELATVPVIVTASYPLFLSSPLIGQIQFQVATYVSGALADISFSFRILVTGQPAKYVSNEGT